MGTNSNLIPIKALHDDLLIDIVDRNITLKTLSGGHILHLLNDDGLDTIRNPMYSKHSGIRPRWARVLAIGPAVFDDIKLGNLILCDTLKWSRKVPLGRIGLETVNFWRINVKNVLIIDDTPEIEDSKYINDFCEKMSKTNVLPGRR